MVGAQALAGFAVEILVKQHESAPVRVLRKAAIITVAGPATVLVGQEEAREAARQFLRNLVQRHPPSRSRRAFDLQVVPVEVVIAFQRLDQEIVGRKPDRSSPVRVASKKPRVRLARNVVHPMHLAVRLKFIGILLVKPGQRAEAVGGKKFIFVEQVAEHSLQSFARRDRQQAMAVVVFTVGDVPREVLPMFQEPGQAFAETG